MRPNLSYDGWPWTIPNKASVGPIFILDTWLCAWQDYLTPLLTLSHFYQPIYIVLISRSLFLTFTYPIFSYPFLSIPAMSYTIQHQLRGRLYRDPKLLLDQTQRKDLTPHYSVATLPYFWHMLTLWQ